MLRVGWEILSETVREDFSKTSIFEAYIESKQEAAMPANEGGVV